MASRALAALVVLSGCQDPGPAPPPTGDFERPQVLFVVQNEVFGVRLDGTERHSFGRVGDDRERAGYPRLLPDGRFSAIGDQVGRVFPYVTAGDHTFDRIGDDGVSVGDGACGVVIGGRPMVVFFATHLDGGGHLVSTASRASTDGLDLDPFGVLFDAALFGPAPDGEGHILAVHSPMEGDDEIWRVDVAADQEGLDAPEVVARVPFPRVALSPSRLTDGRVVYVQFDLRDPDHVGELWLVELDGTPHGTGIFGVDDALAVGDRVVYEASGGNHVADLLVTDLRHQAYNITNTPHVAEHLGWSAAERVSPDHN